MTDDARRRYVNEVLRRTRGDTHDLERIARELEGETVARVRRISREALINIEDVEVYSALLKAEFPQLVYFFASYKSDFLTPDKLPDSYPIRLFDNMLDAVSASLEIIKLKLPDEGLNFLRPRVIARWPWPDEQASGNPDELIGRREFPDQTFDMAIQYRALGRWFMLGYNTRGYSFSRRPASPHQPWELDEVQLPGQTYWPFQMLDAGLSKFFTLYDINDPETSAFAKRTHALWRRISTSRIAQYHPATNEIVHFDGSDEESSWQIGKKALAGALANPKRYAGFSERRSSDGGQLLIGPVRRAGRKT